MLRGKEVIYDERYENGVRTSYQSDFDIMVVMNRPLSEIKTYNKIEQLLGGIVTEEYDAVFADREHAPPQFIVENIGRLANNLKRRQPFFTEIVADGVVLYDNGEVVLPEPQELSMLEKKEIAQEMYDECIEYADDFLGVARDTYGNGKYKMAAFLTHQACENYYRTLGSVFDNFSPKLHNLVVLVGKTKGYSRELASVFPLNTEFEKRAFKLLCQAYIRARYDPKYVVTQEELGYMLERVEVLKELTYRLCGKRLAYYGGGGVGV